MSELIVTEIDGYWVTAFKGEFDDDYYGEDLVKERTVLGGGSTKEEALMDTCQYLLAEHQKMYNAVKVAAEAFECDGFELGYIGKYVCPPKSSLGPDETRVGAICDCEGKWVWFLR